MKKALTAVFLSSSALLAGCHSGDLVAPPTADGKGMQGVVCVLVPVFKGAAPGAGCVVDAKRLEGGHDYDFHGQLLVVRGNLASNVRLHAHGGKLFIDGNVGPQDQLEARRLMLYAYRKETIMAGGGSIIQPMDSVEKYPMGVAYPEDHDPSIIVSGTSSHQAAYDGPVRYLIANGDQNNLRDLYVLPAVRQMLALH